MYNYKRKKPPEGIGLQNGGGINYMGDMILHWLCEGENTREDEISAPGIFSRRHPDTPRTGWHHLWLSSTTLQSCSGTPREPARLEENRTVRIRYHRKIQRGN
jgi:hypothetical protein